MRDLALSPLVPSIGMALIVLGVLLANVRWQFDVNVPRYYRPAIGNKASYPKAYVHAVTAFAGMLASCGLGVLPQCAFPTMVFGILAWEYTQRGTIDRYDIAAGLVGTVAGLLVFLHWRG